MVVEYIAQEAPPPLAAELHEEALDRFLEKDHQDYKADTHELVEYGAYQAHVENLRRKHPHYYECKYAVEYIDCARLFHEAVDVVEQYCEEQYVDGVFNSEVEHGVEKY